VVFLTVHADQDFVVAAQQAGGTGYVVKRRLVSDLMVAVQEARAGRSFVSALS
jgi:DNA-binding NarL/FixJ family response regulator